MKIYYLNPPTKSVISPFNNTCKEKTLKEALRHKALS